jgi:hypothetical protein
MNYDEVFSATRFQEVKWVYLYRKLPAFRCFEDFITSQFDSDEDFEAFLDVDNSDIEISDEKFVIFLEKFSFRFDSDFCVSFERWKFQ